MQVIPNSTDIITVARFHCTGMKAVAMSLYKHAQLIMEFQCMLTLCLNSLMMQSIYTDSFNQV